MLRLPRLRRRLSPLQLLALALLAFSLLARPTLAALGELHELAHAPTGTHLHLGGHADAGDTHDDEGGLHALLHFAHCCGHQPATPATSQQAMLPLPPDADPPKAQAPAVSSLRLLAPFRPPIAG